MNIRTIITVAGIAFLLAGCGFNTPPSNSQTTTFDKNGATVQPGKSVNVKLTFNHFPFGCDDARSAIMLNNSSSFNMSISNWQCSSASSMGNSSGSATIELLATKIGGTANLTFFTTTSGDFVNSAAPIPPAPPKYYLANSPVLLALFDLNDQSGSVAISDHVRLYSNNKNMQKSQLVLYSSDDSQKVKKLNIDCKNYIDNSESEGAYSCQYDLPASVPDYAKYNYAKIKLSDGTYTEPSSVNFSNGLLALNKGSLYFQQAKYISAADWLQDNQLAKTTSKLAQPDYDPSQLWIKLPEQLPTDTTQLVSTKANTEVADSLMSSIWTVSGEVGKLSVQRYSIADKHSTTLESGDEHAKLCKSSVFDDSVYVLSNSNPSGSAAQDYSVTLYSAGLKGVPLDLSNSGNYTLENMLTRKNKDGAEDLYVLMRKDADNFKLYTISLNGQSMSVVQENLSDNDIEVSQSIDSFNLHLVRVPKTNTLANAAGDSVMLYESYHRASSTLPSLDLWYVAVGKVTDAPSSYRAYKLPRYFNQTPAYFYEPYVYFVSQDANFNINFQLISDIKFSGGTASAPPYDVNTLLDFSSIPSQPMLAPIAFRSQKGEAMYNDISEDSQGSNAYWTYNDGKVSMFFKGSLPLQGIGVSFPTPGAGNWILQAG